MNAALVGNDQPLGRQDPADLQRPPALPLRRRPGRGDTNGQGLDQFGGGWYVVSPAGKKIEGDSSTSTASGGEAGCSYGY